MTARSRAIRSAAGRGETEAEGGPYRRLYRIAGAIVQVESPIPFSDTTFEPKFVAFRADGPPSDVEAGAEAGGDPPDQPIRIRHHFALPDEAVRRCERRREVYREAPWAVFRAEDSWVYEGILPSGEAQLWCVVVADEDHSHIDIYHPDETAFRRGGWHSLSMLPTDQIVLARSLASRQACYLHSSAVILDRQGFVFVGHSDAGKTTISRQLTAGGAELLCDDRNIVRRWPDGFRLHGTWSHGDIPEVSGSEAPLKALLFLKQAERNRLVPLAERDAFYRLTSCVVRPLLSADWWEQTLDLLERLAREVPCHELEFDTSGEAPDLVASLLRSDGPSPATSKGAPASISNPKREDTWNLK